MYDFKEGIDSPQERRFFTLKMPMPGERTGRVFTYLLPNGRKLDLSETEAGNPPKGAKLYGVSDGKVFLAELEKAVAAQNEALRKLMVPRIKTIGWYRKRQKIADDARAALIAAQEADREASKGNMSRPNSPDGHVEGGNISPILQQMLQKKLQRS